MADPMVRLVIEERCEVKLGSPLYPMTIGIPKLMGKHTEEREVRAWANGVLNKTTNHQCAGKTFCRQVLEALGKKGLSTCSLCHYRESSIEKSIKAIKAMNDIIRKHYGDYKEIAKDERVKIMNGAAISMSVFNLTKRREEEGEAEVSRRKEEKARKEAEAEKVRKIIDQEKEDLSKTKAEAKLQAKGGTVVQPMKSTAVEEGKTVSAKYYVVVDGMKLVLGEISKEEAEEEFRKRTSEAQRGIHLCQEGVKEPILSLSGEALKKLRKPEKPEERSGKKGWELATYWAMIDGKREEIGKKKASEAKAEFGKLIRGANKSASLHRERKGDEECLQELTDADLDKISTPSSERYRGGRPLSCYQITVDKIKYKPFKCKSAEARVKAEEVAGRNFGKKVKLLWLRKDGQVEDVDFGSKNAPPPEQDPQVEMDGGFEPVQSKEELSSQDLPEKPEFVSTKEEPAPQPAPAKGESPDSGETADYILQMKGQEAVLRSMPEGKAKELARLLKEYGEKDLRFVKIM